MHEVLLEVPEVCFPYPKTTGGTDSNYAAQEPSEPTNSETSTDFALKVPFANPKRKPSPV